MIFISYKQFHLKDYTWAVMVHPIGAYTGSMHLSAYLMNLTEDKGAVVSYTLRVSLIQSNVHHHNLGMYLLDSIQI